MQKLNMTLIKIKGYFAVLWMCGLLLWVHLTPLVHNKPWLNAVALLGVLATVIYLFKWQKIERNEAWRKQLGTVIQKMSAPVLITDNEHAITYANDSFYRLPFAAALAKCQNLPELLTEQMGALQDEPYQESHFHDLLQNLGGKLKLTVICAGHPYEWVLMPLFSPTQERCGTLAECTAIKTSEVISPLVKVPSLAILEQIAIPFLFINDKETISFINLSLKATLSQYQRSLHSVGSDFNFNATDLSLKQFLSFVENGSITLAELIKEGTATAKLGTEQFNLTVQPLWDAENQCLGMIVLWHKIENDNFAFLEKELMRFTRGLADFKLYQKGSQFPLEAMQAEAYQHPLLKNSTKCIQHLLGLLQNSAKEIEKLNGLINTQSQSGSNQTLRVPINHAIEASEHGMLQSINIAQAITLVLHQLHENQITLVKTQEFLEKVGKFGKLVKPEQLEQMHQHAITLIDTAKQTSLSGKDSLYDLLNNFDGLKNCWNKNLENLKSCLQLCASIETQGSSEHTDYHTTFEQMVIEVDETKQQAEDILLEGIKLG